MSTITVMMVVWGVVVTAFVILMVYRAHLTNYETDQLFLSEAAPSAIHQEQDDIVRRVNKLNPLCKGVGGVAVICTLAVGGLWISDLISRAAR
jgi:hypothetical protein